MLFFFFSSRRRHTRWPRDWSSDVCSSDLIRILVVAELVAAHERAREPHLDLAQEVRGDALEIGRASCRERVEISVVAVSVKRKTEGAATWGSQAWPTSERPARRSVAVSTF